jgi:putative flippase GtrA
MSDDTGTPVPWYHALLSRARIGKFVSVGALGATADTVVLVILAEGFGLLEEAAVLAGIETSILLMFTLNEYWTFPEVGQHGHRALLRRLGRSHMVRSGAVVVQFLIFVVLYRFFFVSIRAVGIDLWLVAAKLGGIGIAFVLNYIMESLFTWRVQQT